MLIGAGGFNSKVYMVSLLSCWLSSAYLGALSLEPRGNCVTIFSPGPEGEDRLSYNWRCIDIGISHPKQEFHQEELAVTY